MLLFLITLNLIQPVEAIQTDSINRIAEAAVNSLPMASVRNSYCTSHISGTQLALRAPNQRLETLSKYGILNSHQTLSKRKSYSQLRSKIERRMLNLDHLERDQGSKGEEPAQFFPKYSLLDYDRTACAVNRKGELDWSIHYGDVILILQDPTFSRTTFSSLYLNSFSVNPLEVDESELLISRIKGVLRVKTFNLNRLKKHLVEANQKLALIQLIESWLFTTLNDFQIKEDWAELLGV